MSEEEVPDGSGLRLGERLGPVVYGAAGPHGRPAGGPLVAEVPVGVDTHTLGELWVDGARLPPKSVVVTRVFVTCVGEKLSREWLKKERFLV